MCIRTALRSRDAVGTSSEWWPTPWSGAPLCSGHIVANAVSAPGPRRQMARLDAEGAEANGKGPPGKLTIRKQTFSFCGVHSGQHTLRTGLVKPPRSQLGVEGILCLTKVEGPFQSTQGAGGRTKANALPGCMGTLGVASAPGLGALKVGPRPQRGRRALGFVQLPGAGCSKGQVKAQGDRTAEHWDPLNPALHSLFGYWLPEKGDAFWKNGQIANQSNSLICR